MPHQPYTHASIGTTLHACMSGVTMLLLPLNAVLVMSTSDKLGSFRLGTWRPHVSAIAGVCRWHLFACILHACHMPTDHAQSCAHSTVLFLLSAVIMHLHLIEVKRCGLKGVPCHELHACAERRRLKVQRCRGNKGAAQDVSTVLCACGHAQHGSSMCALPHACASHRTCTGACPLI